MSWNVFFPVTTPHHMPVIHVCVCMCMHAHTPSQKTPTSRPLDPPAPLEQYVMHGHPQSQTSPEFWYQTFIQALTLNMTIMDCKDIELFFRKMCFCFSLGIVFTIQSSTYALTILVHLNVQKWLIESTMVQRCVFRGWSTQNGRIDQEWSIWPKMVNRPREGLRHVWLSYISCMC